MRAEDALGARELGALHDAVVDHGVRHDEVFRPQQLADYRDIGGVAADEGDGVLGAAQAGERGLQIAMDLPLAGRQPAGRHRCAEAVDCVLGRRCDVGMAVQAEIVVGGEIRDRAPVDRRRVAGAPIVQAIEGVADAGDVADRLPDLQDLVLGQRRRIEASVRSPVAGPAPGRRWGAAD